MSFLDSNIKLNRIQKYFLNEFKEDLSDEQFNDLKFMIGKFFNKNKEAGKEEKINWTKDFVFNEILNHTAIQLANAYFKLSFNYSSNSNLVLWKKEEERWREYRTSIESMIFETKEEIQNEIDRISLEYKKALAIQDSLFKQKVH